jgi:hypothetical protein
MKALFKPVSLDIKQFIAYMFMQVIHERRYTAMT